MEDFVSLNFPLLSVTHTPRGPPLPPSKLSSRLKLISGIASTAKYELPTETPFSDFRNTLQSICVFLMVYINIQLLSHTHARAHALSFPDGRSTR